MMSNNAAAVAATYDRQIPFRVVAHDESDIRFDKPPIRRDSCDNMACESTHCFPTFTIIQ